MGRVSDNYISLAEASRFCSYSQDYLSLRARQGKLRAEKHGRNWVTKKEWLEEYLKSIGTKENDLSPVPVVKKDYNWGNKLRWGVMVVVFAFVFAVADLRRNRSVAPRSHSRPKCVSIRCHSWGHRLPGLQRLCWPLH